MPVLHKTVGHLLCVLKQMSNMYNIFDKQIKTMPEWPKVNSPNRQQTHLKEKKNSPKAKNGKCQIALSYVTKKKM